MKKSFTQKILLFAVVGMMAANAWGQPRLASEYCKYPIGEGNTAAEITWTTVGNDVVITISAVAGSVDPSATRFRDQLQENNKGNGMCDAGLAKFKVGENTDATEYFEKDFTSGNVYTLKLKDGVTPPTVGTQIKFSGYIEYQTENDPNAYPAPTLSYSYGYKSAILSKPTNIAISAGKAITFDAVEDATSYKAFVYGFGELCYEQEVTNGGTLNFTPRIASTYQVVLQAYGAEDSFSPASDEYDWEIATGTPGGYAPISAIKDYVIQNGSDEASQVLVTWITNLENGDLEITIAPKEGGSETYTYWVEDGMRIGGFRFNGESTFADYFDAGQGNNVPAGTTKLVYHPKTTGSHIPQYGDVITFTNNYIVYRYAESPDHVWPNNITLPNFVYGTNCDVANDHVPPVIEITKISSTVNSVTLQIDVTEKNDADEDGDLRVFTIRDEANGYAEEDVVLDGSHQVTLSGLHYNTTYTFTVKAEDMGSNITEESIEVVLPFNTDLNLCLGRGDYCTASAVQNNNANVNESKAVDGNASTFWTCYGQGETPAWWQVDLGTAYDVNRVVITFNDIAAAYNIYCSTDNSSWVTVVEGGTASSSDTRTHSGLVLTARYFKVTSSHLHFGIKEFEVYGTAFSVPDATNPTVSVTCPAKTINSATLQINAADLVDSGAEGAIAAINISGDHGFEAQNHVTLDGSNQITLEGLTYNTTYTFTVTVFDRARNQASANITVQLPLNTNFNLARGKNAVAGKTQGANEANLGCDGDEGTMWSSYAGSESPDQSKEWWYVDLGALYTIRQVSIKWMNDNATRFLIQGATTLPAEEVRENDDAWTTYLDYTYAEDPLQVKQDHAVVGKMRYLRLKSLQNADYNGINFYELEVYGSDYATEDNVAPVITTKSCTTDSETGTATLTLAASDAVDGAIKDFYISCADPVMAETKYTTNGDDQIAISGLENDKDYSFTVRCRDLSGNWTSTTVVAHFAMALGTNVAEHKTATAGSVEGDNTADKAVDGDNDTKWGNYTGSDLVGNINWWKVDLHNAYKLTQIAIKWEWYPEAGGIIIEGSVNDIDFTEIVSYSGERPAGGTRQVLDVPSSQLDEPYRFIRIKATNQAKFMSFYEFEVYASEEIPFATFGDDATDNSAVIASLNNAVVDVVINRTILTNDGWYTLCLPFDMSAAKVVEVFGSSTIAEMTGAEDRGSLIHLNFDYVNAIEAGKAYLFKPGNDFTAGTIIEGVTIKNVTPIVSGNALMHFQGIYDATTLTDDNIRFVADDDYLYSPAAGGTNMGAFRCFFTIPDGSPASAPGRRAKLFFGEETPTDVENIQIAEDSVRKILRDGQFLIIRDGHMYNAQGMLIK